MIFTIEVCLDRLADQFCQARSSIGIAGLVAATHGAPVRVFDLVFRLQIGVYYDGPDGRWCPEPQPVVFSRLIVQEDHSQLHLRDEEGRREGECVVKLHGFGKATSEMWCFPENDASVPIEHTGVECYNLHRLLSEAGSTYEVQCELRQLLPGENPFWMRETWPPDYINETVDDAAEADAVINHINSTSQELAVAAPVTEERDKRAFKLQKKRTFRNRKLALFKAQDEHKAQKRTKAPVVDDLDDIFSCI